MYSRWLKRFFDILISSVLILLLSPFILLLLVYVRLFIGSPIFFKQMRPGLNEKPFYLYKFRTMVDKRDDDGNLLSDEQRLTSFGKVLRKLSIDELPELFNVLKGDMSLVGPRPLLMEYLSFYTHEQRQRHKVRPGMTGWAQINGRNLLTWEKKFELDNWYVNHHSLKLDFKIVLLTIVKILKCEGISAEGHVTMTRFDKIQKKT